MLHAINTQGTGLAPYSQKNNKSDEKSSLLNPIPVKNEAATIAAIQWLSESKHITKFNYALKSIQSLQENNQIKHYHIVLNFQLTEYYANHIILLRGLFEFSNPSIVSVLLDRSSQTFAVEINSDQAATVTNYLETIFTRFDKEIDFKAKLKEVIRWEKRLKKEQNLVYKSLFNI